MSKRTINGEMYERTLVLDRAQADDQSRSVPAALSSEVEVDRWFGKERLVHEADAIDLSRTDDGLPMLFNHNSDLPIGVIRDIEIQDRKLRGVLHFSNNAKASEVWGDVRDGFLKDISIGYRIQKWEEENDSDLINVTRWMLHEASVVSVPADATVGINRKLEGQRMSDTPKDTGGDSAQDDDGLNVVDFKITRERNLKEGKAKGMKQERKRISDIRAMFGPHLDRGAEYADLMDECIDKGVPLERATAYLLDLYGGEHEPLTTDFQQDEHNGSLDRGTTADMGKPARMKGNVSAGTDSLDKFLEGAERSIIAKAGLMSDKSEERDARSSELGGMSLSELAREYLRVTNINAAGMDKRAMVGAAFTRGIISHGTSDFANLLENVANKAALIGFDEAEETWSTWCRSGSLPDFRQGSRVNMSTFGDLDIVYENGEYKYGTFSDLKETLTLVTYGKLFSISRQAIINDDVDAFSRIPRSMGRAANRKVGDLAYAVLTGNPTMNQDSTALFIAGHSNFVANGSGAAPSVATLETAFTAMATQTDPAGNTLNIMPNYLIVPHALRGTAEVLQSATYDPAGTAGTLTPNTVQGRFQVVADARLDSNDAAAWFLAGNQNVYDTVEVAFLDGNDAPYLESKDGWSQDGVEYKVRIDAVAAPLDFRALYMNDGN